MEHAKADHPEHIKSIGISTGWEVTGRWEISNIDGLYTLLIHSCLYNKWFYQMFDIWLIHVPLFQLGRGGNLVIIKY